MRVAVVQTSPTIDLEHNFEVIRDYVAQASSEGATLVVFPEESMLLADDEIKPQFGKLLADGWPKFEALLAELAHDHALTIIAAGYEPNPSGVPFNTILAVNPAGEEVARYHKVHLYDAFSYRESDYITHGDALPPIIEVDGFRIGIANCYDLRFPELFRSMADRGVDVISLSAAWVSGKGKEMHWELLTQARAIENVSWVIASGTVQEDAAGLSRVIDPMGIVVAGLDAQQEGIVFAEISRERIKQARAMLPALENRRIETQFAMKGQ